MMARVSPVIHGTFTVPAGAHEERLEYRGVFHDIVPDTAHLQGGTRLQLNALAAALG
jgi:hypothetical protein